MSELNENDFPPLEPQPFVTEEGREIERLRAELAAMRQQRDEAHGLIRKWRLNLVDVVEVGEYMDAMTSDAHISMSDADKRAFLEATR